ncbi:Fungalysin metallopeptidase-domain-containing protein [Lactarius psammicola]|nr:Fungalysin metallopeptidase-domain-containing protein [Lactarius psammicola]
MVLFPKLLPPVLLALFSSIPTTSATPWPATFQHTTHRRHYVGADRSLKLEVFHPEIDFRVDPFPKYRQYIRRSTLDTGGAAVSFLASKLRVSEDSVHFRTSAQGQAAHHVFMAQKINGIPVANAVANVAFNKYGKVSSYSSSFVEHTAAADASPSVSLSDAIATAEKTLHGTYNGQPATLEFVVQPNGFAALAHVIQIQNENTGTWYEAFVDAHNNTILSVTDFVVKALYNVIPLPAKDPDLGIDGFVEITDPENLAASPNGWHQEFDTVTNSTDGNNAIAYKGTVNNTAVETSPVLNFEYVADPSLDPTFEDNVPAAITNAFYIVNAYHDFAYLYGFTEATFNFQTNNFDKGGAGQDRILVSVQDDSGINNADFGTPPDGQSGKMRLFLYDFTPKRDSALEHDLVIHECQHGTTNRMTGGGTGRCFQTLESGAVAEGFADVIAVTLAQNETVSDYALGKDISNSTTGIRQYLFSTSSDTNPLRYSSLNGMTDVHDMGAVFANTLFNVYAALVNAFGWSRDATEDSDVPEGNAVFYHLFFDALILQPCNPTFTDARDAWILADSNRFDGANACLLWQVFASKGFGVAAANYVDDTSIPTGLGCDFS